MCSKIVVRNLALKLANIQLCEVEPIVVLCVGSDKVVGDMLGVIVGERLRRLNLKNIHIYGDIDEPITQHNIKQVYARIKEEHAHCKIIVVDSRLGDEGEVGHVTLGRGGVLAGGQFGEGVKVGDYNMLGVVCPRGICALSFLSSVKVAIIKKMSDIIIEAFVLAEKYKMAL